MGVSPEARNMDKAGQAGIWERRHWKFVLGNQETLSRQVGKKGGDMIQEEWMGFH
jgi:hypothetical protein